MNRRLLVEKRTPLVLTMALVGFFLGATPALAERASACEEGRYRIDPGLSGGRLSPGWGRAAASTSGLSADFAEVLLFDADGRPRAIRIEDGMVAVEGVCEERPARLRSGRRGVRVGARWRHCGELASRVTLRARIAGDCSLLRGSFSSRQPRARVRFQADRIPECGDGVVDVGEACDAGGPGLVDCCTESCEQSSAPRCQPTPECGGEEGGSCGRREFCDLGAGRCGEIDVPGFCEDRPRHCTRQYQPVCGCDGKTYANDCERRRARVQKDGDGECGSAACGTDLPPPFIPGCPEDQRCDPPPGTCLIADAGGRCVGTPELCPEILDPVCGCDGVTYDNDCERLRAGVAKDRDGACETPQACGGFMWPPAPPCGVGQRCDQIPGTCNMADVGGTCTELPEVCIAVTDPVCGCNGVTYANDCERLGAGAAKHRDGVCDIACETNSECGGGFFCQSPIGQCGAGGVCAPSFPMCTREYDPVCGCDGRTHSNACTARSQGVSIASTGECPEP